MNSLGGKKSIHFFMAGRKRGKERKKNKKKKKKKKATKNGKIKSNKNKA